MSREQEKQTGTAKLIRDRGVHPYGTLMRQNSLIKKEYLEEISACSKPAAKFIIMVIPKIIVELKVLREIK